jgi:4-hydroxy 2-oxovalerate aldolase
MNAADNAAYSIRLRPLLSDLTIANIAAEPIVPDLSMSTLNSYFLATVNAGIDVADIGTRSVSCSKRDPQAFSLTDNDLEELFIPSALTIGVSIRAQDLVATPDLIDIIDRLFPVNARNSKVGLVRIDCHQSELVEIISVTKLLEAKGFQAGINLLYATDWQEEQINQICRLSEAWPISVINIVDSLGVLRPESVTELISVFRAEWSGHLGFRARDNMRLALLNTLTAIDEGVTWIDSSIDGIGKGAGNTRTEELVIEARLGLKPDLASLLKFSKTHIKPLKQAKAWGTNPLYYFAGMHRIDSAIIEELEEDCRFNDESIMTALTELRDGMVKGLDFCRKQDIDSLYRASPLGSWHPVDLISGREVLFLGHGSGVHDHKTELEAYITKSNPVVISLAPKPVIEFSLVDAFIVCHPLVILANIESYVSGSCPVIMPASMLPQAIAQALDGLDIYDYGLSIQENTFECKEAFCTVPVFLDLAYCLAAATSGRSKRILIAGFDGFPPEEPRSGDTGHVLSMYQQVVESAPLFSLTPTIHQIQFVDPQLLDS